MASSPMRARRLPRTICPPVKMGWMAEMPAMVPFFIMVIDMGEERAMRASAGRVCARLAPSSGVMNSEGSMSILAMPRLALNQAPVALTEGK